VISKLYAEFENYVSDSITERIRVINVTGKKFRDLPETIQAIAIDNRINHDHYRQFYASKDEFVFLKRIKNQLDNGGFSWDPDAFSEIDPENILKKDRYPSIENIKILYRRVGVQDIVGSLNRELRKNSVTFLQSINDLRCGFVHEANNPAINETDIVNDMNAMVKLVMALDYILYQNTKTFENT